MILEEYLDGDELDVDVFFIDGNAVYYNVVHNHPAIWTSKLAVRSTVVGFLPLILKVSTEKLGIFLRRALIWVIFRGLPVWK